MQSTTPMPDGSTYGKFVVGEVYYELQADYYMRGRKTVGIVTAWVFNGEIEKTCALTGKCSLSL